MIIHYELSAIGDQLSGIKTKSIYLKIYQYFNT